MVLDVCLVNMPYAALQRPSLGASLLASILERSGLSTKILYANLSFAEVIGAARYRFVESARSEDLLGEWTFGHIAFPEHEASDDAYLTQVLERILYRPLDKLPPVAVVGFRKAMRMLRDRAEVFVDDLAHQIIDLDPKIVGCTSTFQQHVSSLALLKRVRELKPEIVTMLGGANCETVMGVTTHRCFDWVDFVVSGEADGIIVELCNRILSDGRSADASTLPVGVFAPGHRTSGYPFSDSGEDASRATSKTLANLPAPDFGSYFEFLENSAIADQILSALPIETSRGCWWGERMHCTFCGLNGTSMAYRRRPPGEVLAEFKSQAERYGSSRFEIVDNILDMKSFQSVLPSLAESSPPLQIFVEVKANLRRSQVRQLREAGVTWMQPGIESLHSDILKSMRKGTQAWINLQLLRWSREVGIRLSWSILFAFPHEEDSCYLEMAEWLPLISHLQSPDSLMSVRIDRYSPYHLDAETFGLNLRPARMAPHVYPLPQDALMDLTYFFENEPEPDYGSNAAVGREFSRPGVDAVRKVREEWQQVFWSETPPVLSMQDERGVMEITDTRPCAREGVHQLRGLSREIYQLCDEAPSRGQLVERVVKRKGASVDGSAVEAAIVDLEERKLLLELDGRLVALAIWGDAPPLPRRSEFPGGFLDVAR